MKTLLWLDDIRSPHNPKYKTMVDALLTDDMTEQKIPGEVFWVRNHFEFTQHIITIGLPDIISFDHDLAESHYNPLMYKGVHEYNKLYKTFIEPTGYDCAKWLVDYCIDFGKKLPEYNCHSQNPAGKQNILSYLNNYKKSQL